MILVHIKTRLDLLGIQTFRWDQNLGRQYSNLNRHVSTQDYYSDDIAKYHEDVFVFATFDPT